MGICCAAGPAVPMQRQNLIHKFEAEEKHLCKAEQDLKFTKLSPQRFLYHIQKVSWGQEIQTKKLIETFDQLKIRTADILNPNTGIGRFYKLLIEDDVINLEKLKLLVILFGQGEQSHEVKLQILFEQISIDSTTISKNRFMSVFELFVSLSTDGSFNLITDLANVELMNDKIHLYYNKLSSGKTQALSRLQADVFGDSDRISKDQFNIKFHKARKKYIISPEGMRIFLSSVHRVRNDI